MDRNQEHIVLSPPPGYALSYFAQKTSLVVNQHTGSRPLALGCTQSLLPLYNRCFLAFRGTMFFPVWPCMSPAFLRVPISQGARRGRFHLEFEHFSRNTVHQSSDYWMDHVDEARYPTTQQLVGPIREECAAGAVAISIGCKCELGTVAAPASAGGLFRLLARIGANLSFIASLYLANFSCINDVDVPISFLRFHCLVLSRPCHSVFSFEHCR